MQQPSSNLFTGAPQPRRWAREHGCEWSKETCAAAARGGHDTVLLWARAHGCEWDGPGPPGAVKRP
jgi:hypothetical protein